MKKLLSLFLWLCATTGFGQNDSVTYLNTNFEEVAKTEAVYYRISRVVDARTGRGYQKDFFISGERYKEINFSKLDSIKDGLSLKWFKNGQLREKVNYVNGNPEGKSEDWYEDGQIKWETGW